MTRINADLPPAILTDQHLFAEYREIRRLPKNLLKSLSGKSQADLIKDIPADFRLGTGHVKFFYDKGQFLINRYALLRHELVQREYRLNDDGIFDNLGVYEQYPVFLGTAGYAFSHQSRSLIIERIMERIRDKPHFYTLRKLPIETSRYYALLKTCAAQ